jgi:hypothetical protein
MNLLEARGVSVDEVEELRDARVEGRHFERYISDPLSIFM